MLETQPQVVASFPIIPKACRTSVSHIPELRDACRKKANTMLIWSITEACPGLYLPVLLHIKRDRVDILHTSTVRLLLCAREIEPFLFLVNEGAEFTYLGID